MKRLPKKIYVRWEEDRDAPYLIVYPDPEGHAEVGENVVVGVYELVHKGTIVTKPELLLET